MFCVVQEVKLKNPDIIGNSKKIETYTYSFRDETIYAYRMSNEKFERNIKKAYKISIHKSYREKGKVKKKQWAICTIGYYEMLEYGCWINDYCNLEDKAKSIGITEDELCDLIYDKLNLIEEKNKAEYQETEEYKTILKHKEIGKAYNEAKAAFKSKYGFDKYDYCYDVFGVLRNKDKLNEIIEEFELRKEYEEKSRRSYYENFKSNYNYNKYSSYYKDSSSNYNEDEKKLLKEAFKLLAMKYHPDRGGDNEKMAMINNLKEKIL